MHLVHRESQARRLCGNSSLVHVRASSPRVIPATHFKRVYDRIAAGTDCCEPCPSVYSTSELWKRYQLPPHALTSPYTLPPIFGSKSDPNLSNINGGKPGAFELLQKSNALSCKFSFPSLEF